MGYGRSAQAPTFAKMSQAFRSLVLVAWTRLRGLLLCAKLLRAAAKARGEAPGRARPGLRRSVEPPYSIAITCRLGFPGRHVLRLDARFAAGLSGGRSPS